MTIRRAILTHGRRESLCHDIIRRRFSWLRNSERGSQRHMCVYMGMMVVLVVRLGLGLAGHEEAHQHEAGGLVGLVVGLGLGLTWRRRRRRCPPASLLSPSWSGGAY